MTQVQVPTDEEIEAARTIRGGWTRDQLAAWGVSWPPPGGWREQLRRTRAAMNPEKPIHVRVAEALGWSGIMVPDLLEPEQYAGSAPGSESIVWLPRFDIDWNATGPLIEQYFITIHGGWMAMVPGYGSGWQDTPLLAVCHLVLKLADAGKLSEAAR